MTVLPNGLDPELFTTGMRSGKRPTVVFNGSLAGDDGVHDLRDFCRAVLPLIDARVPEVRLVVAARSRPAADGLATLPGVEVVAGGDVRRYFNAQTVAVAPLRAGSDARSLVLEPLAGAVPVVATTKACGELGARAGQDLEVADDPSEFAEHVVRLLESPTRRRELGEQGRRFVESRFSWETSGAQLAEAIDAVTGGSARPAATPPVNPLAIAEKR
jgi:glycosyltransferase involved in cell wall biosynthesis